MPYHTMARDSVQMKHGHFTQERRKAMGAAMPHATKMVMRCDAKVQAMCTLAAGLPCDALILICVA